MINNQTTIVRARQLSVVCVFAVYLSARASAHEMDCGIGQHKRSSMSMCAYVCDGRTVDALTCVHYKGASGEQLAMRKTCIQIREPYTHSYKRTTRTHTHTHTHELAHTFASTHKRESSQRLPIVDRSGRLLAS